MATTYMYGGLMSRLVCAVTSAVPNSTLIGTAYSNWPAFPSEHVDIDSTGPAGAARLASTTAATLFNLGGGAIGVYAFPAAIRMSAGLDKPFDCVEPGESVSRGRTQPVPCIPFSSVLFIQSEVVR